MEEEKTPELEEKEPAGGPSHAGGDEALVEPEAKKHEAEAPQDAAAAQEPEQALETLEKARDWLKANQGNLKYLSQSRIFRLEKLLDSEEPSDAEAREARGLQEELEQALDKIYKQRFDEAKAGLVKLREEMFKIPGYENLPDELQDVALNTFTNCELRLSNTRLVDELTEIFDNFKDNVYPDLAGKIQALENPSVLPLSLAEILDSLPRLAFNNEEELEAVLAQLREAALAKLSKAKKTQGGE